MFDLDSARTRSLYILVVFFFVLSLTGFAWAIQTHVSPENGMEALSPENCEGTYDKTLMGRTTKTDSRHRQTLVLQQ